MSTFRRRLMQKASDSVALPDGCTRLACLVSTGTQWIDTEHICQADEDIYIDAYFPTPQNQKVNNMMGWRWSGNYTSKTHCIITQDGRDSTNKYTPYVGIGASMRGTDYADFWTTQTIGNTPNRFQIEISPTKQQVLVNGNIWGGVAGWTDQYGGNYTNYLFALNDIGNIDEFRLAIMQLYEYWVKDANGNFVQHLIPILDANNVPCMYDLVSSKFHHNMGDGVFLYGLNEPLIINYSNAYIDTLIKPSVDASIEVKYNLLYKDITYPAIFGTGASLSSRFEIIFDVSTTRQVFSRWGVSYANFPASVYDISEVGMYPDRFILNDEIIYEGMGTNVSGGNIHLFKTSRDINTTFHGIIYSFKIFEGNTLVRDFVPHYQDGKWGMLDKVENKFYTSPNGELFDGYIPNE